MEPIQGILITAPKIDDSYNQKAFVGSRTAAYILASPYFGVQRIRIAAEELSKCNKRFIKDEQGKFSLIEKAKEIQPKYRDPNTSEVEKKLFEAIGYIHPKEVKSFWIKQIARGILEIVLPMISALGFSLKDFFAPYKPNSEFEDRGYRFPENKFPKEIYLKSNIAAENDLRTLIYFENIVDAYLQTEIKEIE